MVIESVYSTYIFFLHNVFTWYMVSSTKYIMNHLMTSYGWITVAYIEDNKNPFKNPWISHIWLICYSRSSIMGYKILVGQTHRSRQHKYFKWPIMLWSHQAFTYMHVKTGVGSRLRKIIELTLKNNRVRVWWVTIVTSFECNPIRLPECQTCSKRTTIFLLSTIQPVTCSFIRQGCHRPYNWLK